MKRFLEGLLLAACFYILVGVFSLAFVASGEDIAYIGFWHAPWRWLFQALGFF